MLCYAFTVPDITYRVVQKSKATTSLNHNCMMNTSVNFVFIMHGLHLPLFRYAALLDFILQLVQTVFAEYLTLKFPYGSIH